MKKKSLPLILCLVFTMGLSLSFVPPSDANPGRIAQGVVKTVGSVFALPLSILEDSTQVFFPFGIVTGTVKGAVRMLTGVVEGVVDIGVGAAPYAKYMVFFI